MPTVLASRRFSLDDQRHFAALTGDVNPVHLDALAARRTLVGQVVVHGMHTMAWALESHLRAAVERDGAPWRPTHVAATFPKPVFLDADVEVRRVASTPESVHLRALQGGVPVLELRLRGEVVGHDAVQWPRSDEPVAAPPLPTAEPTDRGPNDLDALRGAVDVVQAPAALRAAFPYSCALLGAETVARMLAASTLVGMECPGLHSLLSTANLRLDPAGADASTSAGDVLTFAVRRFASTYSLVDMAVEAPGVAGTVMAFLRPAPAVQPSSAAVAVRVRQGEFAGQRALIVGGSRGLGELTAKIVAAGGGAAIVTYRHGRDDAQRVAEEIRRAGGTCAVAQFDVENPTASMRDAAEQLTKADIGEPTHLYYFATPRISGRRAPGPFDEAVFSAFTRFYVRGFVETVTACRSVAGDGLRVLYPSTVFVDAGPAELVEYAAAKAAGEAVAQTLDSASSALKVVCVRLPRLPTDQTADIQQSTTDDPLPVMVEAVRSLDR